MAYTQKGRFIAIDTPLGPDELLLAGFSGTEAVSGLFHFDLKLYSENHNIKFDSIIGQNVTLSVMLADGNWRYINGIISCFSQTTNVGKDVDLNLSTYSAVMVPQFWLFTRSINSRIFQNMSVPDIVDQIFKEKNLLDCKISLKEQHDKRDYCVQYNESDFNFISRLFEDEGIFYFFEHESGKHTMVIADAPEAHKPCPHQANVSFEQTAGGWTEEDNISELQKQQKITTGKITLNDYSFKIPSTDLKVEVSSQKALASENLEIYEYPGIYAKRNQGEQISNVRIQQEERRITNIQGNGICRAFTPGYRIDVQDHPNQEMNSSYILTEIQHQASEEESYLTRSGGNSTTFNYANSFSCIPADIPYRPQRTSVKPVMRGTQTAIVTGPSGEEIYTDKYGRIKVQFHWDREGKRDENSSCWIRVGQTWAGAGWGALHIPRIGQEVIVDFMEGDPDQPLVIGSVYHGTNQPPYSLPGDKTKSTVKSDSSKGGGGSNELRFEDKKGSEEIYLHGQKDWTIAIDNDKNQTVGNNETKSVGVDESITIGSNRSKSVGVDQSETIGSNKTIQVGVNHTETVGANMSQSVGSSKTETISAAKALTIGAAYQVTVGAAMNETVGAAKAEEIGGAKIVAVGAASSENVAGGKTVNAGKDISESAGKNVSLKSGQDTGVTSGKKMSLSAGDDFSIDGKKKGVINIADQLTIKVGSASITMKKNGDITIKGKKIELKGQSDVKMNAMKISAEGKTKTLVKGAMVNVEASGINTIKGSLVKIN